MAGKGNLVGSSPSDSIATKHGGSPAKFSHKAHPGGKAIHKGKKVGNHHGPHGKKM